MLVVSIDTLRADRLGCYGYGRDTSPALDGFAARRAVRFQNAIAESPWTLPSHVTLLSGLHPRSHQVTLPDRKPSGQVALLAERLSAGGWYAFGLTDGGWMSPDWGFDRGFQSFHGERRGLAQTLDEFEDYVRHRDPLGPWFAFLHTYDVHCPYEPPEPWASRFLSPGSEPIETAGRCGNPHFNGLLRTPAQDAFLSDRYDAGVRHADENLARLFAFLEEGGLLERTLIVLTSDHGEELGEHGQIGHERTLSQEVLRIPLLLAVPGVEPGAREAYTGLADVVPTILELLGEPVPEGLDGRSLVPVLAGRPDATRDAPRHSTLDWQLELDTLTGEDHPGGRVESRGDPSLPHGYRPRPFERVEVRGSGQADELDALGYGGH